MGRPWELTPTQRGMLTYHLGEVLFYRDRAALHYHFSKISDEGVAELLRSRDPKAPPTAQEQQRGEGFRRFTAHYDLPGAGGVDEAAAREFLRALKKKRVPNWVLMTAPLDEIREAAGEVST